MLQRLLKRHSNISPTSRPRHIFPTNGYMTRRTLAGVTLLTPVQMTELRRLLDKGRFLQAYQLAEKCGPLETWAGTDALCLAGQLAAPLGAPRLSRRIQLRAYHRASAHPEAFYYFVAAVLALRGPWEAWLELKEARQINDGPVEVRSDLLALRARVLARLRDFETAEKWLEKAEQLTARRPFVAVERAKLLEEQDRYEEALTPAQQALSWQAGYPAGVQAVAHLLQLLGRDQEALTLLQEALAGSESSALAAQLALLQLELLRPLDALTSLRRFEELTPLREPVTSEWLAARRADAAAQTGDLAQAAGFARQAHSARYERFAARCEEANASSDGAAKNQRRLLSVGFVRQHSMTCAPATLSALSLFWNKPAEHLAVAEEICYGGTTADSQRCWAEKNGWYALEFRVTRESALALIDRGVPFALSTLEATSGHLQAVVGYDALRDCFLIRDPYLRDVREFDIDPFLERYRACGPRGLLIVPADRMELLAGVELPDAPLYDQLHALHRALAANERARAHEILESMRTEAPDHRLTLEAGGTLASYDHDYGGLMAVTERLLEQFPRNAGLCLQRLACLRQVASREERLTWLQSLCAEKDCAPVLWFEYATELADDARDHDQARRWIRRATRTCRGFSLSASMLWARRDFEAAVELYRIAACLEDKNEGLARTYFNVCCTLRQAEVALRFLVDRFERFGALSHQPAATLFWAHCRLNQVNAAFVVLEKALKLRPDDGQMMLVAADAFARFSNYARSDSLLEAAKEKTQRTHWLRLVASVAALRSDFAVALDYWKPVLAIEPLAVDAHAAVASLLAETEGRAAARKHIEEICARFPQNFALHQLWHDWLREGSEAAREPLLRKLIAINPANSWCHKELAQCLSRQRRHDEALAAASHALALAPDDPNGHTTRGFIHRSADKLAEARVDFRKALTLSLETPDAIHGLMDVCSSPLDRRDAAMMIGNAMKEQNLSGSGLLAVCAALQTVFSPQDRLRLLPQVLNARPELWEAWSVVIHELLHQQQPEPALTRARDAVKRFPEVYQLKLDLAKAQQAMGHFLDQIRTLEEVLKINPTCTQAVRQLANAYHRVERTADAKKLVEELIAHTPRDAENYGVFALFLWHLNEKPSALEHARQAALRDVDYRWAWQALRLWGEELGHTRLDLATARQVAEKRPGDARVWLLLASMLDRPKDSAERASAIERALLCDPQSINAHDWKARTLAATRRWEEAAAAARPAIFGAEPPPMLRLRAAWLEVQRGHRAEGIRQLRALLKEFPDFFHGWFQLCDWLWASEDYDGTLEAAQRLLRLAPQDPSPQYFLGNVELSQNHRDAAKEHFRNALALDPCCLDAGCALFDLLLEEKRYRDAEETLNFLKEHNPSSHITFREARLALCLNNATVAIMKYREICQAPLEAPEALSATTADLAQCGLGARAEALLCELFEAPKANPQVAAEWVRLCLARGNHSIWRRLRRLDRNSEMFKRAVIEYLSGLTEEGRRAAGMGLRRWRCRRRLGKVLRQHQYWLRQDEVGWAMAASALTYTRQPAKAIAWTKDWKERENLASGTLSDLVLNLQRVGNESAVAEVCRCALELPRPGAMTPVLTTWLALEEALAGETNAAAEKLARVKKSALEPYYQCVFVLAQALIETGRASLADQKQVFERQFKALRQLFDGHLSFRSDRPIRRAFKRTIARLAQSSGDWRVKAWGWRLLCRPI